MIKRKRDDGGMDMETIAKRGAEAIVAARTLIVTAGAGMGVDSGLPDFRGDRGFWKAYPMYERLGLTFVSAANPEHFRREPAFGWGFYGHRTNLYRSTRPHEGFQLIQRWIARLNLNHFVVTSNVDGHFQKAGFKEDHVVEVHGSIHYLQCIEPCEDGIWENDEEIPVDLETMRARHVPRCRYCGAVARPNILMFGDFGWIASRTAIQEQAFQAFLAERESGFTVVLEMGAGSAVPTIRHLSERLGQDQKTLVIRINPREPEIGGRHLSMTCGALDGLAAIDRHLP